MAILLLIRIPPWTIGPGCQPCISIAQEFMDSMATISLSQAILFLMLWMSHVNPVFFLKKKTLSSCFMIWMWRTLPFVICRWFIAAPSLHRTEFIQMVCLGHRVSKRYWMNHQQSGRWNGLVHHWQKTLSQAFDLITRVVPWFSESL